MEKALEQAVRRRSNDACEYCRVPQFAFRQRFPIDHIIARQHGGATDVDNLALCCPRCNLYKGPNIASLDPLDGALTPLYHPRRDRMTDHFRWEGALLIGLTPPGRATVRLLNINLHRRVLVRQWLSAEGVYPLVESPKQKATREVVGRRERVCAVNRRVPTLNRSAQALSLWSLLSKVR